MTRASSLRRVLAATLLAVALVVTLPGITGAGGCDDPGYIGNCARKNSTSSPGIGITPPVHHPAPAPVPPDLKVSLRIWLLEILRGLIG